MQMNIKNRDNENIIPPTIVENTMDRAYDKSKFQDMNYKKTHSF